MDKITEMQVFATAARQGGFSAAARELNLSPSAVSKLVTRMEERLGVRLFNRTTRALHLTEGGQGFLARCVEILADIEEAEELLTGYGKALKGTLRVNSSSGFSQHQLIPLIPEFQRRYPELNLELHLTGKPVDLVAENVDLAIRLGALKDGSLVAKKLGESPRIICASPAYLACYGTPRTPAELLEHCCLRLSTSEHFNQWCLTTRHGPQVQEVKGRFVTDNVEALHRLALHGGGIARLSAFMVGEDIKAGRLVPLLEPYNREVQVIHAVYPHRRYLPAKVRVFVDYLLEAFTPNVPWQH